jgi:hypothetical protein
MSCSLDQRVAGTKEEFNVVMIDLLPKVSRLL